MNNPDSVMVAYTPMDPDSYQLTFDAQVEKYINIVNFHRKSSSKNKAMLSFKYDELTLKVTIIQIIIILFSTAISFIEALKNHYALNENIFNVIIVTLSTSVALIMAVYRFLKYEEKKENVKNAIQDHVFIINKFRKIYSQIESVKEKPDYIERFNKIVDNFENETFDNYISIRENFDTIFSFRDSIYYKNKYKKNLLKLEKANNEIEMIDDYKHDNIEMKEASVLEKIFCCISHKIDYDAFIESGNTKRKTENEERKKKEQENKEKREQLLKIQNKELQDKAQNLESFLVNKNQILEDQLARLQKEFNELQKEKQKQQEDETRRSVYACAMRTVSPVPVNQERNVRFEAVNDNDSDITQAFYSGNSDVGSPEILNQETKAAYELQINRLKQELEKLTCVMGETACDNLSEIDMLRKKIASMDAEQASFQRYREVMEAEMTELRRRHQDVYDRSAPASSAGSEENQYLKNKLQDYEMELARKGAEIAKLNDENRRQVAEREESERIHRRDMSVITDDYQHLQHQFAALKEREIDIIESMMEKKQNSEEKEKNVVFEEENKEENLVIAINEIDTDSETGRSESSSPGTLV